MKLTTIALIACFAGFISCKDSNTGSATDSATLDAGEMIKNPNSASGDGDLVAMPKIRWDEMSHDFGKIYAGQKVQHAFRLTNVGNADLILQKSSTSCGCTVAEMPKEPIKPGQSTEILVSFEKRDEGDHKKQITIIANTQPNAHYLFIEAHVIPEKSSN